MELGTTTDIAHIQAVSRRIRNDLAGCKIFTRESAEDERLEIYRQ